MTGPASEGTRSAVLGRAEGVHHRPYVRIMQPEKAFTGESVQRPWSGRKGNLYI